MSTTLDRPAPTIADTGLSGEYWVGVRTFPAGYEPTGDPSYERQKSLFACGYNVYDIVFNVSRPWGLVNAVGIYLEEDDEKPQYTLALAKPKQITVEAKVIFPAGSLFCQPD